MPPKPDLVFRTTPIAVETVHSAFTVQLSPAKPAQDISHATRLMAPIIEDWVFDSEDEFEPNDPQIIPTEIKMPTYRTAAVDVVNNDEELRLNLDLLEERRERVAVCEARAKSKMMKYYNARVCGVAFKPGDFVYRSNDASHAIASGKLGPK
nr:reverse transcriptase domain-containing protein [Tanacetum cinerariifolium]